MTAAVKLHPDYLALIRQFPLRPIRTRRDHDAAMRMVGPLAVRDKLSSGEEDYLLALTTLIEEYDRRQRALSDEDEVTGVELLRNLMETRDMNVSDLGRVIGSQPNASLILSGKRDMSKAVIRKLADHFHVSPELFLR